MRRRGRGGYSGGGDGSPRFFDRVKRGVSRRRGDKGKMAKWGQRREYPLF